MSDESKDKKGGGSTGIALGMCIGLSIGTAVGAATHNIGLWMPDGLSIGMCLGLVMGGSGKEDEEDKEDASGEQE